MPRFKSVAKSVVLINQSPQRKARTTYGTFAKAMTPVTNKEITSLADKQEQAKSKRKLLFKLNLTNSRPVSTPADKFKDFDRIFQDNDWWLKGENEEWYPFDDVLSQLKGLKMKRDRIFGFWVNTKKKSGQTNNGDATTTQVEESRTRSKRVVKGPADIDWKLPLWLKAQAFDLICYNNPFLTGLKMEMTDERLDQLFDKQIIVPQKHRFFIVKLNDRFAPKYGFSKSLDGDHLLKP